jgi:hypothetical protein
MLMHATSNMNSQDCYLPPNMMNDIVTATKGAAWLKVDKATARDKVAGSFAD